ncbi:hypothetical protein K438DRAFT_1010469 [Mycena galopus ATCC 62051]|nr:hypothetical protein K438DRAFT_961049 [Mycena galopus ATCC 62051]KAF8187646.1 hypothetical protein K438DRAFT_1010469 [Mycena galopus ATCC 62051]
MSVPAQPVQYYCTCEEYCHGGAPVSLSSYTRHAKYRHQLRTPFPLGNVPMPESDDLIEDMDDGSPDDDSDGGIANDLAPYMGEIGDGSDKGRADHDSEDLAHSVQLDGDGDGESGPPRKRQKLDNDLGFSEDSAGLTVRQYVFLSMYFDRACVGSIAYK